MRISRRPSPQALNHGGDLLFLSAAMDEPSEQLLARYQAGDKAAADEIFRRYVGRLTVFARARLAPRVARRVDPEDVVLSAYRSFFIRARDGRLSFTRSGDLWRVLVAMTLNKVRRQVARHEAEKRAIRREEDILAEICFLVIELIDGNDLSQYVGTRMAVATALDWVAQAADALAYAHREGVVHRDVKPGNLLLDGSGRIHVADFGLALAPAARLDGAGEIAGTVSYMAPEQLFGHDRVGPRADLFSLGAVLHALLHGRPPDAGGASSRTVRHASGASEMIRDLAPAVVSIVSRCLAFDPNERFSDADELAQTLRAEARRIGA